MIELHFLRIGARIGYISEDINVGLNDMQCLKPTIFLCIPEMLQQMQQIIIDSNLIKYKIIVEFSL